MSLRNDLNGWRVKRPYPHQAIYLVDEGKKRWIPNVDMYNLLFSDWNGIIEDILIGLIPTGIQIPETASLVRFGQKPEIYLFDGVSPNQGIRHIVDPSVMDHYNFDWNQGKAPAIV